jgi:hypothetical protein
VIAASITRKSLTFKLSDRRGPRATAEADNFVKPVTHKTETIGAGSLERLARLRLKRFFGVAVAHSNRGAFP